MNETQPLVTIHCLVYNHEPYLRQCLDGFVMQKTDFRFEAIVHDDASTDGSAAIIKEYARKYPSIIKPIFENENQYSKHDGTIRRIMNEHTRGKYVAICEGDDYWIDPLKLQKQVDLLESNPSISLCCGGYIRKQIGVEDKICVYKRGEKGFFEFSLKNWGDVWYTQPLTMLYRKEAVKNMDKYRNARDTVLVYNLLSWGNGIYISECLGVYNIHKGGVYGLASEKQRAIDAYISYRDLYMVNSPNDFLYKKYLYSIMRRMIYEEKYGLFKEGWRISSSLNAKCKLLLLLLFPSSLLYFLLTLRRKIKGVKI